MLYNVIILSLIFKFCGKFYVFLLWGEYIIFLFFIKWVVMLKFKILIKVNFFCFIKIRFLYEYLLLVFFFFIIWLIVYILLEDFFWLGGYELIVVFVCYSN